MTREEAIANLKMIGVAFVEPITKEQGKLIDDTFGMAIKALEQEPCEDCVSRQAAIEAFWKLDVEIRPSVIDEILKMLKQLPSAQPESSGDAISRQEVMDCFKKWQPYMATRLWDFEQELSKLPSVTPQPRWIPVTERLPKVGREVLVCFDFKGARTVYIANFYGDGEFHGLEDEYLTTDARKYRKAVAWMPLPKPYKGESEEGIT